MDKSFHVFNNHADADKYSIAQQLALSPEQRIALCCEISLNGWKLHNPSTRIIPLREALEIQVRSLDGVEVRNGTVEHGDQQRLG